MPINVKADYKNTVIGFNNSSSPLGSRDDLHLLLRDAKAHNDTSVLGMFEEVPDEEQLLNEQEKAFNEKQELKNVKTEVAKESVSDTLNAKSQTAPPKRVSQTTIVTGTGDSKK